MDASIQQPTTDPREDLPLEFHLGRNYPDPFSERTTIKYCVAYRTRVVLTVHDPGNGEVQTLVDADQDPGTYEVGFSAGENTVPGGGDRFFTCTLRAGTYVAEKHMHFITGVQPSPGRFV
jgi:hypothetical protein